MNRRTFLATSAAAAFAGPALAQESAPQYATGDAKWQAAYDKALAVLSKNVQVVPRYSKPVLIEGADYAGIWMECGPHEALVYRKFRPDVARSSHEVFFELQRMDGQIPCNNKVTETGFGQIQMVVPIAATAWELARATGDEALLVQAYSACSAWDAWLLKYRNTRGTGLTEGFCTYDTGHDNSPRWEGIPPQCPNKDAKTFMPGLGVPRLSPDLSATTYGARRALADMARALGKTGEADRWTESAVGIRDKILDQLYVADDAAFYDLDAHGKFVRVRGDILTRVCSERIPDQTLFDTLWEKQIHNPRAFWAPYPLPSIALDDPTFVRPIPKNSWGGPSQALTALRAPRWMDHYGRSAEFSCMMTKWCEAIISDMTFRQQIDPVDGTFTKQGDEPDYSPCALVMVDYSWRLAGVVEEADVLEWNVRPGHPASMGARYRLPLDGGGSAEMIYDGKGAEFRLSGRRLGRIDGTARMATRKDGQVLSLRGIEEGVEKVTLRLDGRPSKILKLKGNEQVLLSPDSPAGIEAIG